MRSKSLLSDGTSRARPLRESGVTVEQRSYSKLDPNAKRQHNVGSWNNVDAQEEKNFPDIGISLLGTADKNGRLKTERQEPDSTNGRTYGTKENRYGGETT